MSSPAGHGYAAVRRRNSHEAAAKDTVGQRSEREEFFFGIDLILDGVQALIDRARDK